MLTNIEKRDRARGRMVVVPPIKSVLRPADKVGRDVVDEPVDAQSDTRAACLFPPSGRAREPGYDLLDDRFRTLLDLGRSPILDRV